MNLKVSFIVGTLPRHLVQEPQKKTRLHEDSWYIYLSLAGLDLPINTYMYIYTYLYVSVRSILSLVQPFQYNNIYIMANNSQHSRNNSSICYNIIKVVIIAEKYMFCIYIWWKSDMIWWWKTSSIQQNCMIHEGILDFGGRQK